MAITPNTVVHFLNVPLENNYKNQIDFTDRATQTAYMISKKIDGLTFENLTYQRKDNVIRVPKHIDELWQANYVMYQNSDYTNRWFYAFITKMEYINDGRTDVYIETDVWQTWFDKVTLKPSFVEREHVEDDTVGLHTIPENLNVGQLITDRTKKDTSLFHNSEWYWIVVACNYEPKNGTRYAGVGMYAKYPQGSPWFAFPIYPLADGDDIGINALSDWVNKVGVKHPDDIQEMFVVPYQLINASDVDSETHMINIGTIERFSEPTTLQKSVWRGFSDYTPKNNKLFTYPYSFLRITNNMGLFNDYKIEDFHEMSIENEGEETDNMTFEVLATPCVGVSGKIRPLDYQGMAENEDESLPLGKYPTLSWSCDAFTNWMVQNSVNMAFDIVTGSMSAANAIGSGVVTGKATDVVQGATQAVSTMGNVIGSIHQASMYPNLAKGNANAGDVSFNHNLNMFKYLHMRPKKEYLEIIDNFFEMWGYQVNIVKTPKLRTRPHWNYIKTVDVNLDGQIPQDDLTKVRAMFDNGITFWHNGNNVERYDLNNH